MKVKNLQKKLEDRNPGLALAGAATSLLYSSRLQIVKSSSDYLLWVEVFFIVENKHHG